MDKSPCFTKGAAPRDVQMVSLHALQGILVNADVPKIVLTAIESVNPSECEQSLALLVKLLVPEHAHNDTFAQQYLAVCPCTLFYQAAWRATTTFRYPSLYTHWAMCMYFLCVSRSATATMAQAFQKRFSRRADIVCLVQAMLLPQKGSLLPFMFLACITWFAGSVLLLLDLLLGHQHA